MATTPEDGDILLDAGLAPLDPVSGTDTDTVRARRYTHAALADRPVVRLVGDAVAPAEDAALDFLDFAPPAVSDPLAAGRPRGLGYPEWALVHAPDTAAAALAAVRPLERAARLARSKPGHAADAFTALAATLPHSHLPAFWDQAGRAFLAADSAQQAAVMFGRAREAERVYNLPVDEATRRETFLEFAFAGALTAKALSGHAAELAARYDPERAYAEYWELVLRRTAGGLPPWTDLPKQLRSLAKAAGTDPDAAEEHHLRELLAFPAAATAPAGFWKACRAVLVRMSAADPELARTLLGLFPHASGDGFRTWWLGLLADCGVLDTVADPAQEVPGGAARWFTRLNRYLRTYRGNVPRAAFYDLVPRLAARLAADAVPVELDHNGGDNGGEADLDLLDDCLAHGVPVLPPRENTSVNLGAWTYRTHDVPRRDLAAATADPAWRGVVRAALPRLARGSGHLDDLLAYPALVPLVEERLGELAQPLGTGGWQAAREAVNQLEDEVAGPALAEFGAHRDTIAAVDFAEPLARTLRAGIPGELGWPALDEAARELLGTGTPPTIAVTATWPYLTLSTAAKAVAVGPHGRAAEHDLRLPAKARQPFAVFVPTGEPGPDGAVPGEFLVRFHDEGPVFYWSGDPGAEMEGSGGSPAVRLHQGRAQAMPGGGRMSGGRALHPGDTRQPGYDEHVISDGTAFWQCEPDGTLREVDPATGERGRASLPAFLAALPAGQGEKLWPRHCTLAPLPPGVSGGPLGDTGGLAGFAVFVAQSHVRIVAADGTETSLRRSSAGRLSPFGTIVFPGAQRHVIIGGDRGVVELHAADGSGPLWRVSPGVSTGAAFGSAEFIPDPMFWHFLRPRDEQASAVLRELTTARARALLDAATADLDGRERGTVPDGGSPATHKAVADLLGPDAPPALADGVLEAAKGVASVARRRDALLARAQRDAPVRVEGPRLDGEGLRTGLGDLTRVLWRGGDRDTGAGLRLAAGFLTGELAPDAAADRPEDPVHWGQLLDAIGAVAWRAALPTTQDSTRQALTQLLALWADTAFTDPERQWERGCILRADRLPGARSRGDRGNIEWGEGERRRIDIWGPYRDYKWAGLSTTDGFLFDYVEHCPSGEPLPPASGDDVVVSRERVELRWGTAEQLRAVLAVLAERGPLAWDADAVDLVSQRTGLNPSAAALLLAGWLAPSRYDSDQSGKHLREVLGLKSAQVPVAHDELGSASDRDRRALFAAVFPDTSAEIAALWEPGGMRVAAERIAQEWVERFGRREPIPEPTLTLARESGIEHNVIGRLTALRAPDAVPALAAEARSRLAGGNDRNAKLVFDTVEAEGFPSLMSGLDTLIPWLYAELPVGDPVRTGIPRALELLRERLADEGLLLRVGGAYLDASEVEAFGTEPYRAADGSVLGDNVREGGLTVVDVGSHRAEVYFRPALLGGDARSAMLRAVIRGYAYFGESATCVDLLRSVGFTGIARRIAGQLAEGATAGYEADPLVSVPELAAEAAEALKLSADAARLYLQYLALLEPTDQRVKRWNDWTPKRLKAAQAALLDAGLVVGAKRSRAGRPVFLPGGWTEAKAPNKPFETAKAELYGLTLDPVYHPSGPRDSGPRERFLALRPLPEIFTEAWEKRPSPGA